MSTIVWKEFRQNPSAWFKSLFVLNVRIIPSFVGLAGSRNCEFYLFQLSLVKMLSLMTTVTNKEHPARFRLLSSRSTLVDVLDDYNTLRNTLWWDQNENCAYVRACIVCGVRSQKISPSRYAIHVALIPFYWFFMILIPQLSRVSMVQLIFLYHASCNVLPIITHSVLSKATQTYVLTKSTFL